MAHEVQARFTVEVTDGTALMLVGGTNRTEAEQLQATAERGLKELESVARRYGLSIVSSSVTVS